ncbi:hypothetical protein E6W36_07000 [Hankyongella ginsenosidimutans]|uniref:Smr domain-containing protein n=1 Tax=Hankyongella ginsenosidimutans TaxID=1763828 RepID=A0A4D7C6I7_9SPHN|nr:Smr/MutS family protein [Hankyongella ginsenosidimutans]QCI79385.1 hypothetical protein E6W36_07000 [Hankyongella ginsenosidimutans]
MTRRLRPDEEILWARVAALTDPLDKQRVAPHLPRIRPDVRDPGPALPQPTGGTGMAPEAATLDGLWERKIRTGQVQVDRVVDLHGFGRERAYELLSSALLRAARDRARVMLVVTGKGKTGAPWPKQEGSCAPRCRSGWRRRRYARSSPPCARRIRATAVPGRGM